MHPHTQAVRAVYDRFSESAESALHTLAEHVTFHVAGAHPLSGDHVGLEAVRRYLAAVRVAGRRFTVNAVFYDRSSQFLLVDGSVLDPRDPVPRAVTHVLRMADGLVVEYWDNPADLLAENRFWRAHLPGQRAGRHPGATPEPGPQPRRNGRLVSRDRAR